jgi:hypothetical protein
MTSRELRERCERFAIRTLKYSGPLLNAMATRDCALQLRRSATSTAQNYAACTIARSHADFLSKLRIALEEADETSRWFRMLRNAGLASGDELDALMAEAAELTAILGASCATAAKTAARRRPQR